jgi:dynein heavy chain 1
MDDDNNIVAFTSKEGEEVRLKKEVNLLKTPRINDKMSLLLPIISNRSSSPTK